MEASQKEHCQGAGYNITISSLNDEGYMHKRLVLVVFLGGCFVWFGFLVGCLGFLNSYSLLQKNNLFFPSKACDATAASPSSGSSYEMCEPQIYFQCACLCLRDFHLIFRCRLLCAWLVVYSDEICPLHI